MLVNWKNQNITKNENSFNLTGMINPCFQNNGESPVLINGNFVGSGESFSINTHGMQLQGIATITFTDNTLTQKVICNYLVAVNAVNSFCQP